VKTIVFQTYGGPRPAWIDRCIESVRDWAEGARYHYEFLPIDDFLTYAPSWLRARCGTGLLHPVLDYARVRCAATYLGADWDIAVWVDADVLVTRPERLTISTSRTAAFMSETWTLWNGIEPTVKRRYTNCICKFARNDPFTQEYLAAMDTVGRASTPLAKAALGTDLLTAIHARSPLEKIPNVGNLSPHAVAAIATQDMPRIELLLAEAEESLYGVNICASHEGAEYAGVTNPTQVYEDVVHLLINSPELLNYEQRGCRAPTP
jgi:hypothetical protein